MKKRWQYISLKNKIFFLTTLLALMILVIFAGICSVSVRKSMLSMSRDYYIKALGLIEKNIDTTIRAIEDYSRIIASDYRMQEKLSEYVNAESEKDKLVVNYSIFRELAEIGSNVITPTTQISGMAVSVEGKIVYSGYDINPEAVYDILSSIHLEAAYERQVPVWVDLAPLTFSDYYHTRQNVFSVSKLIREKNSGQALGVVSFFINETNFSDAYMENVPGEAEDFYIVNTGNQIISSQDKENLYQNIHTVLGLSEKKFRELEEKGSTIIQEQRIPVLYMMDTYEKNGWRIISVHAMNELVLEEHRIIFFVGFVFLFVVFSVFILSRWISITVTKPIYTLLHTIDQIDDRHMDLRANVNATGEIQILITAFNDLMDKLDASVRQICQEQQLKRQLELNLLQSQIKPHFLYNTMEMIGSFIKLDMKEYALLSVQHLSGFYRMSLSNGNEIITLGEEMTIIENYLSLQKLRYTEYIDFRMEMDPGLCAYKVPKLFMQPLVENAIYHGLKPCGHKGVITVTGYEEQEWMCIRIHDNGVGIPAGELGQILHDLDKNTKSYGLRNVYMRLKFFYGKNCGFRIESKEEEYTQVCIHIPKILQTEEA